MNEEKKEEGTGTFSHYSVLKNEAIEALNIKENGIYVDCTAGGGGHSLEILKRLSPEGRLFCIDRDDAALKACAERLKDYEGRFCTVKSNFSDVGEVLKNEGIGRIDGALLDLGVSSYQLDTAERGFSYMKDAPLDMRMDQSQSFSAYDVVNGYGEGELRRVLYHWGDPGQQRVGHYRADLENPGVPAAKRRADSGNYLPFSGRSDHQADLCFFGKGLYLPSGLSRMRLRKKAADSSFRQGHRAGRKGTGRKSP